MKDLEKQHKSPGSPAIEVGIEIVEDTYLETQARDRRLPRRLNAKNRSRNKSRHNRQENKSKKVKIILDRNATL